MKNSRIYDDEIRSFSLQSCADTPAFIEAEEAHFTARLEEIARFLHSRKELRVLLLCGPSCAGKTTTSHRLVQAYEKTGGVMHSVSFDDFYLDRAQMEQRGTVNYETAQALDLDTLARCLSDMMACRTVQLPTFDFVSGKRAGYRVCRPQPGDLFVLEGIQGFYPEVRALMERTHWSGVFISPGAVQCCQIKTDGNTLRLIRRIVRDVRARGFDAQKTLHVWESVRTNEEKHIFPLADMYADIHINSAFAYELLVTVPLLRDALADTEFTDARCADQAQTLLHRFDGLPQLPRSVVPPHSVLREFVGES